MGWTYGVQFLEVIRYFSLHYCVQTSSRVHTSSYMVGTGGSFPGGKEARV
jgi:hypothetical protein